MKEKLIRQRKEQRVRIARTIKDVRVNYLMVNSGVLELLLKIGRNLPKLKDDRS